MKTERTRSTVADPFRIDEDESIAELRSLCTDTPWLAEILGMQVSKPVEIDLAGYQPGVKYSPVTFKTRVCLHASRGRRVFEPGTIVLFSDWGWVGTMTADELSRWKKAPAKRRKQPSLQLA